MINIFFSAINLGCSKNLIETQHIIGHCIKLGQENKNYNFLYCSDPYDKDVRFVFVNTCGFLSSGRIEMIQTLQNLIKAKKIVYVLGCGVQYFQKKWNFDKNFDKDDIYKQRKLLLNKHMGKKIFLLTRSDIDHLTIEKILSGWQSNLFHDFCYSFTPRAYTNIHLGFEYVKIAEGCNNACSFCIIPQLRGKQKSRPIEQIVCEIKDLVSCGAKEIILLAQDTTRYGIDIYGRYALMDLVFALEKIKGDFRYRILYLYPDILTTRRLKELTVCKKFIPYFDIPFQHVSSNVLKRMGRFYGQRKGNLDQSNLDEEKDNKKKQTKWITSLIAYIRTLFPTSYIRTNFIIGFPGETDEDQAMLLEILSQHLFDNVTLFMYHDEPLATSAKLSSKIPDTIVKKRFLEAKRILTRMQKSKNTTKKIKNHQEWGYVVGIKNKIKEQNNNSLGFGKNTKIIVRPWLHAPDIDEVVEISLSDIKKIIDGKIIKPGVRIQWEK